MVSLLSDGHIEFAGYAVLAHWPKVRLFREHSPTDSCQECHCYAIYTSYTALSQVQIERLDIYYSIYQMPAQTSWLAAWHQAYNSTLELECEDQYSQCNKGRYEDIEAKWRVETSLMMTMNEILLSDAEK